MIVVIAGVASLVELRDADHDRSVRIKEYAEPMDPIEPSAIDGAFSVSKGCACHIYKVCRSILAHVPLL